MRTVYFFVSPMCGACEEWKPTINDFIAKNAMRAIFLRLNPNLKAYEFDKWKVKYTPAAAVLENGQLLRYVEGQLLDATELEAFVFGLTWKSAVRAKRKQTALEDLDDLEPGPDDEQTDEDDEEDE